MAVVIRTPGPEDADALARLVAGFRDHLGAELPTDAELAAALPAALADPQIEFGLALDPEPAGYTYSRYFYSLWSGGVDAHLEDLFVSENARGGGVGRALLEHALARARERGARVLSLNTNEQNARAQALYASLGFRPQASPIWPGGREIHWLRSLGSG